MSKAGVKGKFSSVGFIFSFSHSLGQLRKLNWTGYLVQFFEFNRL